MRHLPLGLTPSWYRDAFYKTKSERPKHYHSALHYNLHGYLKYNLVSIWYLVRRGLGIRWSCQSFSPRWELRKENKKSRRDTTAHFWARKVKLNANANNRVGPLLMHNHVLEKSLICLTFGEKSFGPQKYQISSTGKKVSFWQFFRMGWYGRALLGWPSRIPHRNWKNIFVLSADEYIERLEGKIRECLFFYVKIF